MTILQVSSATTWRGGEQQVAYLLKAISGYGIKQIVIAPKGSPLADFCRESNFRCVEVCRNFIQARLVQAIKKISTSYSGLIIHTHDSKAHTSAFLASAFLGVNNPIIVHRRVDFPASDYYFSTLKYNHRRIFKFICVSNAAKQVLTSTIRHPEKVTVIYSGIDVDRVKKAQPSGQLRNELGLSPDTPLIGNFSALADHKDYPTFLSVAMEVVKKIPHCRFVIAGDGPLRKSLEELIRRMDLTNYVFLIGFRRNTHELLKELNVFLMTSKTEGLGTIILEAMAAGVPVVATRAGGIPEIIDDGHTGLLADPGDADTLASHVHLILTNLDVRNKIADGAKCRINDFDYHKTAEATLQVYQQAGLVTIND